MLIAITPTVLLEVASGIRYVYDPETPRVLMCVPGAEPVQFTPRGDDPAAVWAAIRAHATPTPDQARRVATGLEELFGRLDALERQVRMVEREAYASPPLIQWTGGRFEPFPAMSDLEKKLDARLARLERQAPEGPSDRPASADDRLGWLLAGARSRLGWSLLDMSARTGFPGSLLAVFEGGRVGRLPADHARRLAWGYRLTVEEIAGACEVEEEVATVGEVS